MFVKYIPDKRPSYFHDDYFVESPPGIMEVMMKEIDRDLAWYLVRSKKNYDASNTSAQGLERPYINPKFKGWDEPYVWLHSREVEEVPDMVDDNETALYMLNTNYDTIFE